MSARPLEVSLLRAETVLHLVRDAWSTVKRPRQATTEYPPPRPNTSRRFVLGASNACLVCENPTCSFPALFGCEGLWPYDYSDAHDTSAPPPPLPHCRGTALSPTVARLSLLPHCNGMHTPYAPALPPLLEPALGILAHSPALTKLSFWAFGFIFSR